MSAPLAVDQAFEKAVEARLSSGLAEAMAEANAIDKPLDIRIHKARRAVKDLRALLRLIRPVLSNYRTANAGLRDAARLLSHSRDATVRAALLGKLAAKTEAKNGLGALVDLGEQIAGSPPDPAAQEKLLAAFSDEITTLAANAALWRIEPGTWEQVADGAAKTYRDARRAMARARSKGRPADFHEWRKLVKYHAQQLALLSPLSCRPSRRRRKALDQLGELLGRYHDLDALGIHLKSNTVLRANDLVAFDTAIRPRMARLARKALRSGKARFARRPAQLRADIRKALKSTA